MTFDAQVEENDIPTPVDFRVILTILAPPAGRFSFPLRHFFYDDYFLKTKRDFDEI